MTGPNVEAIQAEINRMLKRFPEAEDALLILLGWTVSEDDRGVVTMEYRWAWQTEDGLQSIPLSEDPTEEEIIGMVEMFPAMDEGWKESRIAGTPAGLWRRAQ